MNRSVLAVCSILTVGGVSLYSDTPEGKKNVLFIAVDDLRPELGCYGVDYVKTPNIDKLAESGTTFVNAYCNVPVCGASRASIMSGMRPLYPKRFTSYLSRADKEAKNAKPLQAHFRENGYQVISNGKIFHHLEDWAGEWSEVPWRSNTNYTKSWADYETSGLWLNPESGKYVNKKTGRGPFYDCADVPDNAYQDGKLADKTVADLKRLKKSGKPFFLACGFWRPHLPFNAPKKYWDMYDRKKIPLADNRFKPKGLPGQVKSSGEIKAYGHIEGFPKEEAFHRLARHGYLASVSYMDAQVGKVVDSLKELGLDKNTVVILWGDHGWHLGEHNFWGKHNILKNATKSPLIMRVPGSCGLVRSLVEFVDIYPTLCESAGLAVPAHCQGKSMMPSVIKPDVKHKEAVFIEWQSGRNVKTDRFSYTEWNKKGKVANRMLFDHDKDPQENENVINKPEYAKTVAKFSALLKQHYSSVK